MQWSRERCKINLIIVARDYNNTMVVNYIYFVLQNHWKGFGMYSFFLHFSEGVVYVYMYVCVYIYICSMCMCVCVYIYVYIYVCICIYMYVYVYVYIYMCVCVRVWTVQGDVFLSAVIFRILRRWDSKYHCWWGECLFEWLYMFGIYKRGAQSWCMYVGICICVYIYVCVCVYI